MWYFVPFLGAYEFFNYTFRVNRPSPCWLQFVFRVLCVVFKSAVICISFCKSFCVSDDLTEYLNCVSAIFHMPLPAHDCMTTSRGFPLMAGKFSGDNNSYKSVSLMWIPSQPCMVPSPPWLDSTRTNIPYRVWIESPLSSTSCVSAWTVSTISYKNYNEKSIPKRIEGGKKYELQQTCVCTVCMFQLSHI